MNELIAIKVDELILISKFLLSITVVIIIYQMVINHKLNKLNRKVRDFMSAVSVFAEAVNTAFAAIALSVDGIVADITWLKDKIEELQGTQGQLTPEDQALLDEIQAKTIVISENLAALDAATEEPPTP